MDDMNNICERCKSESALYHCCCCDPYHNFCSNCDNSIHSFPNKTNHKRILCSSQHMNPVTYQYSPNRNSNKNNNTYLPKNYDVSTDTNHVSVYSKEYVMELKRIFEKEKSDLQYKITLVEDNMERLKGTFQDQIRKMQEESSLLTTKTRMKEEDNYNKIQLRFKENEKTINRLIEENETLIKQNKNLQSKLMNLNEQSKDNSLEYNQQIKELQLENNNLRQLISQLKIDKDETIQRVTIDNRDDINAINSKYQKQINDMIYHQKNQEEETNKEIEAIVSELNEVKQSNDQLHSIINDLVNKNDIMKKQNCNLGVNIDQVKMDLKKRNETCEELARQLEQKISINDQIKNDLNFFEKTINNLKKEISILRDVNTQIDKDYNSLMSQSEKMRKEYSKKLLFVSRLI